MIRKLCESDRQQTLEFLKPQAAENLFIIGDIEIWGFDADFQELWGEFDENNQLLVVLLRYYQHFTVSSPNGGSADELMDIIKSYEKASINGTDKALKSLEVYISEEEYSKRDCFFAECKKESLVAPGLDKQLEERIQILTKQDIPAIITLRNSISEFSNLGTLAEQEEMQVNNLETGAGRSYFISEDNQMASVVSTAAENQYSAMVIGVCSLPQYRNKGYATILLVKMLGDIFIEKESACLFYNNPKAGDIYKRIGFLDIGLWRTYTHKE